MSDFSQNGVVSTLHDFKTKSTSVIESELSKFSKQRKMELILPCLYSELEGSALPKIVEEISKTKYLDHIIIGLDKANETQDKKAWKFFKKLKSPFSILWNDGPGLKKLDQELKKNNLAPSELGKGRNVWYCIGMCIARDSARSVALHDCDIKTYDRRMLAKLFYPVVNPLFNFEFCKGYYPRVANEKMNGRVARLLVFPLLTALEKTIGKSDYLDFMKSFKYPLAGEFSFRRNVLPELRISSDWGIEVGILSEMQRSFSPQNICQVDLADTYDHKHQVLSENDTSKGLSKMSIDITKTLIRKLAAQGDTFTHNTLRTLKATYYRTALDLLEIYHNDAKINGLKLNINEEEIAIELFSNNIIIAGQEFLDNPNQNPLITNWNRVETAMPEIKTRFLDIVESDSKI